MWGGQDGDGGGSGSGFNEASVMRSRVLMFQYSSACARVTLVREHRHYHSCHWEGGKEESHRENEGF